MQNVFWELFSGSGGVGGLGDPEVLVLAESECMVSMSAS